MKQIFIAAALLFAAYYMFTNMLRPAKERRAALVVSFDSVHLHHPVNVFLLQDVSRSVTENGVELIQQDAVKPFYYAWDRELQVSFLVVSSMSAQPPISIELPAFKFPKPKAFAMDTIPYELRNEAKSSYLAAQKKYLQDSLEFVVSRKRSFDSFSNKVETALAPYRVNLSKKTDLITAISIADKQLKYWHVQGARTYLIANTDGLDTYHRSISTLTSHADVLLVNAQRKQKTNLDSIITQNFATVEQAVNYIIHDQTN